MVTRRFTSALQDPVHASGSEAGCCLVSPALSSFVEERWARSFQRPAHRHAQGIYQACGTHAHTDTDFKQNETSSSSLVIGCQCDCTYITVFKMFCTLSGFRITSMTDSLHAHTGVDSKNKNFVWLKYWNKNRYTFTTINLRSAILPVSLCFQYGWSDERIASG